MSRHRQEGMTDTTIANAMRVSIPLSTVAITRHHRHRRRCRRRRHHHHHHHTSGFISINILT